MKATIFDSLTPSERTILRELLRQRDQKGVARELGLSPETVKTHLRNAREKCGYDTSFALAKAFALHEGAPPRWGIPLDGGGPSAEAEARERPPTDGDVDDGSSEELREVRTPFVFEYADTPSPTAQPTREGTNHDGLRRMLAILGIVILLIVVIILAFPLSESFQRLANQIDPPTR